MAEKSKVILHADKFLKPDGDIRSKSIKSRHLADTIPSSTKKTLLWFRPSDMEVATDVSSYIIIPFSGAITKASARVKTAPVGSNAIIDINKNGTTLWASGKLTIVDGANTGSIITFDSTTVSADDYFTLDIDQIGSGTAGADLTVLLEITADL